MRHRLVVPDPFFNTRRLCSSLSLSWYKPPVAAAVMKNNSCRTSGCCPAAQAVSVALREWPDVNASLSADGHSLLRHHSHNLGVAMATPSGLVVSNWAPPCLGNSMYDICCTACRCCCPRR